MAAHKARESSATVFKCAFFAIIILTICQACSAQRDYCMWDSIIVHLPFNQSSGSSVSGYGPTPYGTCRFLPLYRHRHLFLRSSEKVAHSSFLRFCRCGRVFGLVSHVMCGLAKRKGFTINDLSRVTWMSPGLRFDSSGGILTSDTTIDTSSAISTNTVTSFHRPGMHLPFLRAGLFVSEVHSGVLGQYTKQWQSSVRYC